MSLPTSEPLPSNPDDRITASRRRRIRRSSKPWTDEDREDFLQTLTRQVTPSYDFFVSSLLAGVTIAAGLLVQSDALVILGILFAPFLGPLFGVAVSVVSGSIKTLLKSVLSLAAGGLFVFGLGALAGALMPMLRIRPIPVVETTSAYTWPNFLLLAVGSGLSVLMLVRSPRQKPLVANIAIIYGLFPRLTAAGFNLVAYNDSAWIAGITIVGVHLVWTMVVAVLVFILLGHGPRSLFGFVLTALLLGLLAAGFMSAADARVPVGQLLPTPPPIVVTAQNSATSAPTATITPVPQVGQSPMATLTATITFAPTNTATVTITPHPTPIYARVEAPTGGGALLRDNPDGKIISSLLNGNMLEVISDPLRGASGIIWVQVRTESGLVGWVVQSLLATATPAAGW